MSFLAKLDIFRIQQELSKSTSNVILFKRIKNPIHYPKGLSKSFRGNYSNKFCIKCKSFVSWICKGAKFNLYNFGKYLSKMKTVDLIDKKLEKSIFIFKKFASFLGKKLYTDSVFSTVAFERGHIYFDWQHN